VLAFRPRTTLPRLPDDTAWTAPAQAWAVAIEEQVMVLDPARWALVTDLDDLVAALPRGLAGAVRVVSEDGLVELRTSEHVAIAGAMAELGSLRGRLTAALGRVGLRAAVAGSHPTADWRERGGAEPTFALHVHVAVPDGDRAALAHDRLRGHLPLLLALSANSPFLRGGETGMASARGEALADPDAGLALHPERGTLMLGVMDAQTRLADTGALAALAQCLVRLEATRRTRRGERHAPLEALADARGRAAAHGMRADLHDPRRAADRPARELARELIDACSEHAVALDCVRELDRVRGLVARPGEAYQRSQARLRPGESSGGRRLRRLTGELSAAFVDA
jgi:carboxylate-amine ligase